MADESADIDRRADHDIDARAEQEVLEQTPRDSLAADDFVAADHRHGDDRRSGLEGEADGSSLGPFRPPVRIAGDPPLGEHADGFSRGEGGGRGIEGVCGGWVHRGQRG